MDYSKFLNKTEHVVLAYLGGPYAYGKDRRLRIAEPRPTEGFHRFEVRGRDARALEAVESPELSLLSGLPKARGHHVAGWLVAPELHRIQLLPAEELPPLAIVRARRWHSGDLVFESQDFDGEVEETARLRLEKLEPIADVKGVASSLRVAFGIALTLAVARRERIALSLREAAPVAARVADGGEAVARPFVEGIQHQREARIAIETVARVQAERTARIAAYQRERHRVPPTLENAPERAEAVLDAAHGRMLASRRLGGGNLEVSWELMGERFISVVDAITLHVYDSGVCLAGEDELVTLDSLPGVIREAIETGRLVITRR